MWCIVLAASLTGDVYDKALGRAFPLLPCNSSAKPPTPLSPNRGTSVPSASPMCTASCPWCSAVTYLVCSPLQRDSTPHARVPAGSGAHSCPLQKFHARHAGAAAHLVGRCLDPDCVLLIFVVFFSVLFDCRLVCSVLSPTLLRFVPTIADCCSLCESPLSLA
jgi:hypothetical protein